MTVVPLHPAYDRPDSNARFVREWAEPESSLHAMLADPNKAAREIYKISSNNDVGLRVAVGQDSIVLAQDKIKELQECINKSEEFSTDLQFGAPQSG